MLNESPVIRTTMMILATALLLGGMPATAAAAAAAAVRNVQTPGSNGQQPRIRSEAAPRAESEARAQARLVREVRRELGTLPYYDVFDYLEFEVRPDNAVVLRGQTIRPTLKRDAEARLKDIEGIRSIDNQIEVLPLSPNDDRIRVAVYRELFNFNSPLYRYSLGAVPSIRIIVRNGRVTLKGLVGTKADSDLANVRARTVPGVFEVTNELQVERRETA